MAKLDIKSSEYSEKTIEKHKEEVSKKYSQLLLDLVKEETKMVKGIFRVYGGDGNPLDGAWDTITYRKFPEDLAPMFKKTMQDGQTYEVPLYIARHLNGYCGAAKKLGGKINSCAFPIHTWKTTKEGALKGSESYYAQGIAPETITTPSKWKRTYGFETMVMGEDIA